MIFALASIPSLLEGQELSAADVNNLAQNTEILEQIVNGPDKLFLSNWAYAPPTFLLTKDANAREEGLGFNLSEIDVWEGSFVYREGMHTVRVAFQSYPAWEDWGKIKYYSKSSSADGNFGVCLFATFKYTDVPIAQQLKEQPKYAKYNFMWKYFNAYQPLDNTIPIMSGLVLSHEGVTYAEFDITSMGLTPGEVVPLKFRIAAHKAPFQSERRNIDNWTSTFYFSMIYANIAHQVVPNTWTNLPTVTSLSQIKNIVSNQQYLINYFRLMDNPLRAAIWDQVLAANSYFTFKKVDNNNSDSTRNASYGLLNDRAYYFLMRCSQQARYYVQKKFSVKDTLSVSYSVSTNTDTRFTMLGILSKAVTNAGYYRYDRELSADESKKTSAISAAWGVNYNDSVVPPKDIVQPNDERWTTDDPAGRKPRLARTGILQTMVTGARLPASGLATPTGYKDAGYFLFYKNTSTNKGTVFPQFNGFYFVNPSSFNPVAFYDRSATSVLGVSTDYFKRGSENNALFYSDTFNFKFINQSGVGNSSKFYPLIYDAYSGLSSHSEYFIEDSADYTDFSVDLVENAITGNRFFGKANYIATFRLTDVSVRNGSYTMTPFTRLNSFEPVCYSGLLNQLNAINTRLNAVKNVINTLDTYRYIPLFWTKPKSFLAHHDDQSDSTTPSSDRFYAKLENNAVYFSNTRQADYLIVRGQNVQIGWGGFDKVYRDNPDGVWPANLQFEFMNTQLVTGDTIETIVLGFDSLEGLAHGERYYLQGRVIYAAETMGVP
mgnify:CR=1 FL=1